MSRLLILIMFLNVIGCNTNSNTLNVQDLLLANKVHWKKELVLGNHFLVTTYQKNINSSFPYIFYIEGDGLIAAGFGGGGISHNPTPLTPTLLKLFAQDNRYNVIYIGRPCQYTPVEQNKKCLNSVYWTDKRFSKEVVDAIDEVINKIRNDKKFSLIGYSGGGAISVLIAAQNNMVKDIITISGNLDHELFSKFHNMRLMKNSLNPIRYAENIKHIPQLHISGGKDNIVPSFIIQKYVTISDSPCVKHSYIPSNDHYHGWEPIWQDILSTSLDCY